MRDIEIRQGDAFSIPVEVTVDGEAVELEDLDMVEFSIGHYIRKVWPEDGVTFKNGVFYVPLTQTETFALRPEREIPLEVRVKFASGMVLSSIPAGTVTVREAVSREVL